MENLFEIVKEAISKSDAAFINKMDQREINEVAHMVKDSLSGHVVMTKAEYQENLDGYHNSMEGIG